MPLNSSSVRKLKDAKRPLLELFNKNGQGKKDTLMNRTPNLEQRGGVAVFYMSRLTKEEVVFC